jgi:oligoendopeptidase F
LYADWSSQPTAEARAAWAGRYLDMLAKGGSQSPEDLLAGMGIDITDPNWMAPAFKKIGELMDIAEKLVEAIETKRAA